MKKFLIIIVLICNTFVLAQNANLGTSGVQFLEIPVGAKAASMGGAVVGLLNGASSVFWNPAGIAAVKQNAFHISYWNHFDMFDYSAASFVINTGDFGNIGISMTLFSVDEMEETTELKPEGTGVFFDAQDIALGLTYSRYVTSSFVVGMTAKYISTRIFNSTASGFAFDVGTKYQLDFQNLTIAMRMSNFGPDLKFDGEDLNVTHDQSDIIATNRLTPARLIAEDFPLPLIFQVGIGFDIINYNFLSMKGAFDAIHPSDNEERLHFGTELGFYDRFYLRGGYKYNYDDEDFSFGMGVTLPVSGSLIKFDYSYSIYDVLPDLQRASIEIEF